MRSIYIAELMKTNQIEKAIALINELPTKMDYLLDQPSLQAKDMMTGIMHSTGPSTNQLLMNDQQHNKKEKNQAEQNWKNQKNGLYFNYNNEDIT